MECAGSVHHPCWKCDGRAGKAQLSALLEPVTAVGGLQQGGGKRFSVRRSLPGGSVGGPLVAPGRLSGLGGLTARHQADQGVADGTGTAATERGGDRGR